MLIKDFSDDSTVKNLFLNEDFADACRRAVLFHVRALQGKGLIHMFWIYELFLDEELAKLTVSVCYLFRHDDSPASPVFFPHSLYSMGSKIGGAREKNSVMRTHQVEVESANKPQIFPYIHVECNVKTLGM